MYGIHGARIGVSGTQTLDVNRACCGGGVGGLVGGGFGDAGEVVISLRGVYIDVGGVGERNCDTGCVIECCGDICGRLGHILYVNIILHRVVRSFMLRTTRRRVP